MCEKYNVIAEQENVTVMSSYDKHTYFNSSPHSSSPGTRGLEMLD